MNEASDLTLSAGQPTARREFIGQMAASAIVLAGAACATPAAAVQGATRPSPAPARGNGTAPQTWDDSWVGRLTARHRGVFDSPDIEENSTAGFSQASRYIQGMRDALGAGPGDVQTVIVVRHKSVPFAFNDAMWEKYGIGEQTKVKSGDAWATKNLVAHGRQAGGANANDRPQGNIDWLVAHGHIVLACDLATQGFAGQLAAKTNGTMRTIYEDLKANLVPGVILQPNGVYAVHRAQEAGCTYIRSA